MFPRIVFENNHRTGIFRVNAGYFLKTIPLNAESGVDAQTHGGNGAKKDLEVGDEGNDQAGSDDRYTLNPRLPRCPGFLKVMVNRHLINLLTDRVGVVDDPQKAPFLIEYDGILYMSF